VRISTPLMVSFAARLLRRVLISDLGAVQAAAEDDIGDALWQPVTLHPLKLPFAKKCMAACSSCDSAIWQSSHDATVAEQN